MEERDQARQPLTVLGRVRYGHGSRDVTILDLTENGCRFHDRFGRIPVDTPITIKIGTVGPVDAMVRWRKGEYSGVKFSPPLHPAVFDHIRQHFDISR
jgi:hypothetical protein